LAQYLQLNKYNCLQNYYSQTNHYFLNFIIMKAIFTIVLAIFATATTFAAANGNGTGNDMPKATASASKTTVIATQYSENGVLFTANVAKAAAKYSRIATTNIATNETVYSNVMTIENFTSATTTEAAAVHTTKIALEIEDSL
jgi:hypothetical protein